MTKKKSLGHNPLAYSMRGHASFDFITPYTDDNKENDIDSSDKAKSKKEDKINKVVTSYYLEEPVVDLIKEIADSQEMSYSAVANEILKNSLYGS
ncbi:hypothetical protein AB2B38_001580 [Balneola sp. MJW-20]|uniref:hypothetical protein n=1 Tax=Gracilimonas aurantiaca TaxID=3234185 RepID=UPI0034668877